MTIISERGIMTANISLEVLSVDNNIMTFNLKQQQDNGGIYSLNQCYG